MLYCTSMLIINRIKKHDIILCKLSHRETEHSKGFRARAHAHLIENVILLCTSIFIEKNIVDFKHFRRRIQSTWYFYV